MADVWVATSDGASLVRYDRIVEVIDRGTSLALRTADNPDELYEIVPEVEARAEPGGERVLARAFLQAGAEAHVVRHRDGQPTILSAVVKDSQLLWELHPSLAGLDYSLQQYTDRSSNRGKG